MFTHNTRASFTFASSVRVALIAMLLAVGILAFPTTQTNAASCSSYVADSSYGNTGATHIHMPSPTVPRR